MKIQSLSKVALRFTQLIFCSLLLAILSWAEADDPNWPKLLDQKSAWEALPKSDTGSGTPLPTWVRMLAKTLPHTTAASMELEYLYRTEPLLIVSESLSAPSLPRDRTALAFVARYSVANYHQSAYGKSIALADLKRVGGASLLNDLQHDPDKLPALEKQVYQFAKQMAELGRGLSDEEYRTIQKQVGDDAMVGLVLRIAQGCFQDRMLWALGIADIADANRDPIAVHFVDSTPNGANTPTAPREDSESLIASIQSDIELTDAGLEVLKKLEAPIEEQRRNSSWKDFDFAGLKKNLDTQRGREPRIAVPDWGTIAPKLPTGLYRRPIPIRWSRVVVGYQPKLGPAWIKCLRVFEQEAHQNRVFEESVFWVVTRGLRCFYCMGHCEMLMEVGGLKRPGIENRTFRLASGDWSSFSKEEQSAFRFAKKITEAPREMSKSDREDILGAFGNTRAIDLIWWTSRCQFMTKVSDAFQLRLESENVFAD